MSTSTEQMIGGLVAAGFTAFLFYCAHYADALDPKHKGPSQSLDEFFERHPTLIGKLFGALTWTVHWMIFGSLIALGWVVVAVNWIGENVLYPLAVIVFRILGAILSRIWPSITTLASLLWRLVKPILMLILHLVDTILTTAWDIIKRVIHRG